MPIITYIPIRRGLPFSLPPLDLTDVIEDIVPKAKIPFSALAHAPPRPFSQITRTIHRAHPNHSTGSGGVLVRLHIARRSDAQKRTTWSSLRAPQPMTTHANQLCTVPSDGKDLPFFFLLTQSRKHEHTQGWLAD